MSCDKIGNIHHGEAPPHRCDAPNIRHPESGDAVQCSECGIVRVYESGEGWRRPLFQKRAFRRAVRK